MLAHVAAVTAIALISLGQLLLKQFATKLSHHVVGGETKLALFGHLAPIVFWLGLTYAVGAGLWIFVLSRMPLTRAFPYVALTFVLVPILARWFYGEPISTGLIIGSALIIIGVLISVHI